AMAIELDHPLAGSVKLVRSPMKLSGTPATSEAAPPLLGQHTDEVLAGLLGKSREEIAALRAQGVL
ncbi:MAG: CoA transferase, partial [Rubrivivax sp.]